MPADQGKKLFIMGKAVHTLSSVLLGVVVFVGSAAAVTVNKKAQSHFNPAPITVSNQADSVVNLRDAITHPAVATGETHRPTITEDNPLFGQTVFDTPEIDPSLFSRDHDLAHSPMFARQMCTIPGFHCVAVQSGETWRSRFPHYTERESIMRLNRMNVALAYTRWLLLPKSGRSLTYMDLSPMPMQMKPSGHRRLVVDLAKFAFGAYDPQGRLLYWGPASGGRSWCSDINESCETATGHYRVFRKGDVHCRSKTYPVISKGGAPMPYCMFYHKGFAIHASTLAGFVNHSRGCIRLFLNDAKWLSERFVKRGTRVWVKS